MKKEKPLCTKCKQEVDIQHWHKGKVFCTYICAALYEHEQDPEEPILQYEALRRD